MQDANLPRGSVYDQYTWPEIRDLQKVDRVAVIPVAAVEQHGPHLPMNTDEVLVWSVCSEATKRAPDDIMLLPLVPYGTCEMTSCYPGTISISPATFHNYVFDIVKSLAKNGFEKILIINGHGGNKLILDRVARRATSELGIFCASATYWFLISKEIQELRSSEPGGICHACELETSIYLYLDKSSVQMEKAVKDTGYPHTEFFGLDPCKRGVVSFDLPWDKFSKTGVNGDPTVATSEKGAKWLDAAAEKVVQLVREVKSVTSTLLAQR